MTRWHGLNAQQGNAKGLGALLFDDGLCYNHNSRHTSLNILSIYLAAPQTEHDIIQRTLNAIGVSYSHMNDEILVPSKIEEARTKELIKVGPWNECNAFLCTKFFT